MKSLLASSLVLMLLTAHAMAQGAAGELIKQKALQQRDINNQQQGVISSTASAPPPGSTPAAPQGVSSAQQQLIAKVQSDLAAIKPGAEVSTSFKSQLQVDIAALSRGTTRPSHTHLVKLADDLSAALAANSCNVKDQAQLAKDLNIVMNSGSPSLSTAQTQSYVSGAQTVLKAGGVGSTETQSVTSDLKTIVAELQQNKPKLYQ